MDETIRLTDEQIELDEETKAMLNLKLQFLLENPQTEAVFTYFQKDKKKNGGDSRKKRDIGESFAAFPFRDRLKRDDEKQRKISWGLLFF